MFTRLGAVTELRSRLGSDNLPATAGALAVLAEFARTDIQFVADAAQAALREAAVHPSETELHFGRLVQGSPPPHRTVHLLGPPIARACAPDASHEWIRVNETAGGFDVSVDTTQAGTLRGSLNVKGPTGEAVITIDVDVFPPPPQTPPPPIGAPAGDGMPASTPTPPRVPEAPQSALPAPPPLPGSPTAPPATPPRPGNARQQRADHSRPRPQPGTPGQPATPHPARQMGRHRPYCLGADPGTVARLPDACARRGRHGPCVPAAPPRLHPAVTAGRLVARGVPKIAPVALMR